MPTALDLVKATTGKERQAQQIHLLRWVSAFLRVEVNLLRGRSHTESLRKRVRGIGTRRALCLGSRTQRV